KVFGHKFLDVSVEQTLLVRIIIMKGQYHYTHCVPISIMVQQKLTQHMEKSEEKCGFIVARSFQKNQKIKEGGRCNMLMPKRVKYRRQHRGRLKGKAKGGTTVAFGDYGLQALEPAWITSRQIEASRIAISRFMKRGGKLWIKIFPDKPYTAKPLEVRMGSGKGAPEGWVAVVKPGKILFEVAGVEEEVAREALRLAAHKLPIKTKFVKREEIGGESNEG